MKNKDYIPKYPDDITAVERLKQLPFASVRKDVPTLLEWLQDTHWDVAGGIADYLTPHIHEITSELLFILHSDDGMWKSGVIYRLIQQSGEKLDPALINALISIATNPSKIEREDEVDQAAKDILSNKALCG